MNNHNKPLQLLGSLEIEEVIAISDIASQENLKCLSFLDYIGETVFNKLQIEQIKAELQNLKRFDTISKSLIIIENSVNKIPKDTKYYLMFSGV